MEYLLMILVKSISRVKDPSQSRILQVQECSLIAKWQMKRDQHTRKPSDLSFINDPLIKVTFSYKKTSLTKEEIKVIIKTLASTYKTILLLMFKINSQDLETRKEKLT